VKKCKNINIDHKGGKKFNLKYTKKTGITRRDFIKTAVKAGVFGAVLSSGIPPAWGRDKKVLIYQGFGENVGHLSPIIRHDTADGLACEEPLFRSWVWGSAFLAPRWPWSPEKYDRATPIRLPLGEYFISLLIRWA